MKSYSKDSYNIINYSVLRSNWNGLKMIKSYVMNDIIWSEIKLFLFMSFIWYRWISWMMLEPLHCILSDKNY